VSEDLVTETCHRAGAREWVGLAVLALPTLMLSLDTFAMLLALPHMTAEQGLGDAARVDSRARWLRAVGIAGRQTVYVFSSVCQHAIRTGRLQANPVTGIKLPKLVSAGERRFLSHAEVAKLAAEAGQYGTFIRRLAYTGLRWGEVVALRTQDVNLARRRLDVRRGETKTLVVLVSDP
jgi:integrase